MCTSTSGKVSDLKRMFEQGTPQTAPKAAVPASKLGYSKSVIVKPGAGAAYGEQLRARLLQRKSKSPERLDHAADSTCKLPASATTSASPPDTAQSVSPLSQAQPKPIATTVSPAAVEEKAVDTQTKTLGTIGKHEDVSLVVTAAETNGNRKRAESVQQASDRPAVQERDTREVPQPAQTAESLPIDEPAERSEHPLNIATAAMLKTATTKKLQRARSAIEIKALVLKFCALNTAEYGNVKIDNFSTSFCDGLAFCALIHHFYPDAFDYHALDASSAARNMQLAFDTAQTRGGIAPLLDVDDMVNHYPPDWKCVFTYVQLIYQKLLNHPRNKFKHSG